MIRVALALFCALWAGMGAADPKAVFDTWIADQGAAPRGFAMAPSEAATPPPAPPPGDAFDLASNGKVVTALCLDALVQAGEISWETTLTEALNRPAPDVTLAQVVTHSAGIGPDSTQGLRNLWSRPKTPQNQAITERVLARSPQEGVPGIFAYNNENYALLGAVIEVVTQRPFLEACQSRLLTPLGLTAQVSDNFPAQSAYGGLVMRAADHAALLAHAFGPTGRVGADPFALPHVEILDGVYYSLGMLLYTRDDRPRFSHAGALRLPLGAQAGAYAIVLADGTALSMGYDTAVISPDAFLPLDRALMAAVAERNPDP